MSCVFIHHGGNHDWYQNNGLNRFGLKTLAPGSKIIQNKRVKPLFSAINHALIDFLPTKSNPKAVRTIDAENFAQQDQDRLWSGGHHPRVDGSDRDQYRRTSLCTGL